MITWDAKKQARALLRTAQNVYDEAWKHCPVRTGRLRRSIAFRSDAGSAIIMAKASYAPYVEFGGPRGTPNPFLENALYEAAKKAPGYFLEEMFREERSD